MRDTLGWVVTAVAGVTLAAKVAQMMAECLAAREPVRGLVEEALSEHQGEDSPVVQAFAEALDEETTASRT